MMLKINDAANAAGRTKARHKAQQSMRSHLRRIEREWAYLKSDRLLIDQTF